MTQEHDAPAPPPAQSSMGWRELWLKEDWWAIWLGLGIILIAYVLFLQGSSLRWIAVTPARWSTLDELGADLAGNFTRYLAQFVFWLVTFSVALRALGYRSREFIPSFLFVYLVSVLIFSVGRWDQSAAYNLEAPLVALVLGLALSNFVGLPRWFDAGFRVEFYIKTGIVLLGATLPFTLLIWAGPTAILQASIVSIVTFFVIFFAARRLGLDQRFAATLGAGGAVCGVSAAIAISGAVGGKKEDTAIVITVVILWALAMIFFLPLVSRLLLLPAGVAGAWIGTSEFADAAGFAAATAYGNLVDEIPGIEGTADQAVWAFTLVKVVGRDIWIGIWALILAIVATTRWEATEVDRKPRLGEIWWRFPKFVFGFLIASLFVTAITRDFSLAQYNEQVYPTFVSPIRDMRSWAFIFCFFSIGLTTRFRELAGAGPKPFVAFSVGAIVNVILGFVLSVYVFAAYWEQLTR